MLVLLLLLPAVLGTTSARCWRLRGIGNSLREWQVWHAALLPADHLVAFLPGTFAPQPKLAGNAFGSSSSASFPFANSPADVTDDTLPPFDESTWFTSKHESNFLGFCFDEPVAISIFQVRQQSDPELSYSTIAVETSDSNEGPWELLWQATNLPATGQYAHSRFLPDATHATLSFVSSPSSKATWYFDQTYPIIYAAANIQDVSIALFHEADQQDNKLAFLAWVAPTALQLGVYNWSIPRTITTKAGIVPLEESTVYYIVVRSLAAHDLYATSAQFSIQEAPSGPCLPGSINPETGLHPCSFCPRGTFSASTLACSQCPENSTTPDIGAISIGDCIVDNASYLSHFTKAPQHYIKGSNSGGSFIDAFENTTADQCALLCVLDRGCRSFDSGRLTTDQEGDCYLSYDNKYTIQPAANYRQFPSLDHYEKTNPGFRVSSSRFMLRQVCGLLPTQEIATYSDSSLENCAQLCLNFPCCQAFTISSTTDAGLCRTFSAVPQASKPSCKTPSAQFYERANRVLALCPGISLVEVIPVGEAFARAVLDSVSQSSTITQVTYNASASLALAPLASTGEAVISVVIHPRAAYLAFLQLVRDQQFSFLWKDQEIFPLFNEEFGLCPLGSSSITGYAPGCMACPSDTYTNVAQTMCVHCPSGTTSPPNSPSLASCVQIPTSDGFFLTGEEWIGSYTDVTGESGNVVLQVIGESSGKPRLLATFNHGSYCNAAKTCKSAGVAQFYYLLTRQDLAVNLTFVRSNGWAGITDRTFTRRDLIGDLSYSASKLTFSGNYAGPTGSFNISRRCQSSAENGHLVEGDEWQGFFRCAKPDSEEDQQEVFRLSLLIDSVNSNGAFSAVVDFDYETGRGEYKVDGMNSECGILELVPTENAWITGRIGTFNPRLLVGRIDEQAEWFSGQLALDSRCSCLGHAPANHPDKTIGATCGPTTHWCYVNRACPNSYPSMVDGWYYAHCPETQCTDFKLARVCSTVEPPCPSGWTSFSRRCYLAVSSPLPYALAEQACQAKATGGHLVSVQSAQENDFIQSLARGKTWLGLSIFKSLEQEGFQTWSDASIIMFLNWHGGSASHLSSNLDECATLDVGTGSWTVDDCREPHSYICKSPVLGVNVSCSCLHETDESGKGAYCNWWSKEDLISWCYVSPLCPQAIEGQNDRHWTSCSMDVCPPEIVHESCGNYLPNLKRAQNFTAAIFGIVGFFVVILGIGVVLWQLQASQKMAEVRKFQKAYYKPIRSRRRPADDEDEDALESVQLANPIFQSQRS
eukprot:m.862457 g.862457  ORF g.862457 m.862457 type:complete len:1270 (-) comp59692_c0_seq7:1271-5080(-)